MHSTYFAVMLKLHQFHSGFGAHSIRKLWSVFMEAVGASMTNKCSEGYLCSCGANDVSMQPS